MIKLINAVTGEFLGEIGDDELQFLRDQMEEESLEDQDYAITPLELSYFEGQNANPHLLGLLREALGSRDEVTIRWTRV